MKKKIILLFLLMSLLTTPLVLADFGDTIKDIGNTILDIGRLEFLGSIADNQFIGFVRIAIAIIVFALLYLGLSLIPNFSRGIAITIAIVMSIITAIFIPGNVLAAFGATYAILFSFIIIGGPIVGGLLLVFLTPTPNRAVAAIKGVCLIILGVFINLIAYWAEQVYQAAPL